MRADDSERLRREFSLTQAVREAAEEFDGYRYYVLGYGDRVKLSVWRCDENCTLARPYSEMITMDEVFDADTTAIVYVEERVNRIFAQRGRKPRSHDVRPVGGHTF